MMARTPANSSATSITSWSVHHPIGVIMITLAFVVLGIFTLGFLKIDLLPKISYPEVKIIVRSPGVPATIIEDEITRQLEEQLAITADVVHVQSRSRQGQSKVTLSFEYNKDIEIALRDASTRLDRAKRYLPANINPPTIYRSDPSALPVAEFVVNSALADPVQLREWVDYTLSKLLLTLPGVAAAEVGGGLQREIQILVDQDRLAGIGLDILGLSKQISSSNKDTAGGKLLMPGHEITGRTQGRLSSIHDLQQLPVSTGSTESTESIALDDVVQIIDGHTEEILKIRFNEQPGIKLSIQKQPQANTVEVVDAVNAKLAELQRQNLIPEGTAVDAVNDEARYIRRALNNASVAAISGAFLAMIVVYLFLGSLPRTLIIGSAIPIAILVTVMLMALSGLTINIMTLGGLALGVGMLVDSTIVMLENIHRHQRRGESATTAPVTAAAEVSSAIVASTSTNLAAVLPFLFTGGLIGLLFRELIITISAAIVASMIVALTLVPALAAKIRSDKDSRFRSVINRGMDRLQIGYVWLLTRLLRFGWFIIGGFVLLLVSTVSPLLQPIAEFLPSMDDGRIGIYMNADKGTSVERMDLYTQKLEALIQEQAHVKTMFTTTGGFIYGRSVYQAPNRANIQVQLVPHKIRQSSSEQWLKNLKKAVWAEEFVGVNIYMRQKGIRGLHLGRGDDDLGFRITGTDLRIMEQIGDQIIDQLRDIPGIRNVKHSSEKSIQELAIKVDRQRAAKLGLSVEDIGKAVRFAVAGQVVTNFLDNDRRIDVLLRLQSQDINSPADLDEIILFSNTTPRKPIRLSDVASIRLIATPAKILREQQQRIVEVSASLTGELPITEVLTQALQRLDNITLPPGYTIYEAGNLEAIQAGQKRGYLLLALALFLVLVVMAVQYESLRNPLIIMGGVVFAAIGVALGLRWTATPISMPVWLGLIMLTGIVVNNAIVLIEYIELQRKQGMDKHAAILEAARLRLRPILMTTLTTVVGMLPLALALGEGSEMLQPLAITIVSGLSFSVLVSLLLVPAIYQYAAHK